MGKRALLLGVIGYAICQWAFLAAINHCRFFDRGHAAEVAEFRQMTVALGDEVRAACATGAVRQVLLTDADVASPYLVGQVGALPGCAFVRETVVTPFTAAELLHCGALVVEEEHLPAGTASSEELPPGMRVEHAWASGQGHFGYTTYRAQGCGELERGLRRGLAASAPGGQREGSG